MMYKVNFWIFILFFNGISVFGQYLRSDISSNEVRVGDVFTLNYSVSSSDRFPQSIDSSRFFPALMLSADSSKNNLEEDLVEIISVSDTVINLHDSLVAIRSYNLIAWDSCALSLVGFKYSKEGKIFQFPPCFINILYYDMQQGIPLKDIKEYFNDWKSTKSKKFNKTDYRLFVLIFSLVVVSLFLWFWFRKRAKKRSIDFQKTLQEVTLDKIQSLRQEELWKNNSLQEHFVRFSHILRSYLTGRFGLSFLDKTTEQSKLILMGLSIERDLSDQILQLLQSADMVKFADSSTDEKYISVLFDQLIEIVNKTSPIPTEL